MKINTGVLTSSRTKESDEQYTPFYAVEPLLQYIKPNSTIWCPFDLEWSAYVTTFEENGFNVIKSHLDDGLNFFEYEPEEHYDLIVSNPPFTKKDQVLERLKELDKPFALLLPLNSLQGKKRFESMDGIQLLFFNERIGYHNPKQLDTPVEGSPFASGYFCKDFLPKDLIGLKLNKFKREIVMGKYHED